jgi:hypothetical protein
MTSPSESPPPEPPPPEPKREELIDKAERLYLLAAEKLREADELKRQARATLERATELPLLERMKR